MLYEVSKKRESIDSHCNMLLNLMIHVVILSDVFFCDIYTFFYKLLSKNIDNLFVANCIFFRIYILF